MEPEIIDLGNIGDSSSGGGMKSTNFGPGIELLMNDKSKSSENLGGMSKGGDSIHLDDLDDLEKDLNDLTDDNDNGPRLNVSFDEVKLDTPIEEVRNVNNVTIGEATRNTQENQSTWDGFAQMNEVPITPGADVSRRPMSKEESLKEKFNVLRKLEALEKKGVELTKKYSMDSDLMEMKGEYEMLVAEKERSNSVKFQGNMLAACINGIEFLNNRFDPFDLKLDGWGEQFSENVNDYDEIFAELHDKYRSTAKMAPELKLVFQLAASGMMVHMTNTMFKSAMPNMDDVLRQNPDLMNQFNTAAMNSVSQQSPGFGGFMNNIVNGDNSQGQQRGASVSMGPPPPAMRTQEMPPPRRPGSLAGNQPNRPDLVAARSEMNDAVELSDNYGSVNSRGNEKSLRPISPPATSSRPEMKGPSDISDLLGGLKPKVGGPPQKSQPNMSRPKSPFSSIHDNSRNMNPNGSHDPFANDRKSPAPPETKSIKDINVPSFDKPISIEKEDNGSTISLSELKELEAEGKGGKKPKRKQRSSRNTVSLDI
jgi:hypothetical protein